MRSISPVCLGITSPPPKENAARTTSSAFPVFLPSNRRLLATHHPSVFSVEQALGNLLMYAIPVAMCVQTPACVTLFRRVPVDAVFR